MGGARLVRALEARAARAGGEERVDWLLRAHDVRPYRVDAWLDLRQARIDLRDVDGAADGQVSALVEDTVGAVHPVPLVNDSTVRWHIVVTGHSVENRLLLRDLTLWLEERVPSREAEAEADPGSDD